MFWSEELKCLLMVYVDDFKMSGSPGNLKTAWASAEALVCDATARFGIARLPLPTFVSLLFFCPTAAVRVETEGYGGRQH